MFFRSFAVPGKEQFVTRHVVVESGCANCAQDAIGNLTVNDAEYPGELVDFEVINPGDVKPDEEVHRVVCSCQGDEHAAETDSPGAPDTTSSTRTLVLRARPGAHGVTGKSDSLLDLLHRAEQDPDTRIIY